MGRRADRTAPWETHERTLAFTEYSKETGPEDIPYYPKRLAQDKATLQSYARRVEATEGVTFLGRLATYRYLDMEKVIDEALTLSRQVLSARAEREPLPKTSVDLG